MTKRDFSAVLSHVNAFGLGLFLYTPKQFNSEPGILLGYCIGIAHRRYLELWSVATFSDCRRIGVATKLVKELLKLLSYRPRPTPCKFATGSITSTPPPFGLYAEASEYCYEGHKFLQSLGMKAYRMVPDRWGDDHFHTYCFRRLNVY
jgi:hypothetical protein